MSQNEELPVERLLEQMPLQQPSQDLDDAVSAMTRQQLPMEIVPGLTASFGWRSLAATALVCASVGILIGRWIPRGQTFDSADSKSHLLTTGDVPKTSASRPADQLAVRRSGSAAVV